jgi:protein involved in polysaccharide export with SLBB domain
MKILFVTLLCTGLALSAQLLQAQNVSNAPRAVAVGAAAASLQTGVALRVGDQVAIKIANVPQDDAAQFDGGYTLDENGNINLPYIGLVKAAGIPPSQVQTLIQSKLISAGIYTNPTIVLETPQGSRYVSVSGQVRAPSRIPFTSDLTLMTAIEAAGGKSDFGGDKIRLVHGGKVQMFSYRRLEKDPSKDVSISPGDQIEIMQSWF